MPVTADFLIKNLKLTPNPEGGYFRETYREPITDGSGRAAVSIIYYLLTPESPVGRLHRQSADAIHYFHLGSALDVYTIDAAGHLKIETMGVDLYVNQTLQLVVPGNTWKALELRSLPYALISEVVCPGWEADDDEAAGPEFLQQHPQIGNHLNHLIRKEV